jgi:hypothetical protein
MDPVPEPQLVAARSQDSATRYEVATWRGLHPQVQNLLSEDSDCSVRAAIAARATSREALERLARDPQADVRAAVAGNDAAPAELLTLLARDRLRGVRASVLHSRNVPDELVTELAADKSVVVRWNVIQFHAERRDLLHLLSDDPDEMNAHHARTFLKNGWTGPQRAKGSRKA